MKYATLVVVVAAACTTQTTPQQDQATLQKRVVTTCPDYSDNAPSGISRYCALTGPAPDLSCINDALASNAVAVMAHDGSFGIVGDPNASTYAETIFAADGKIVDIAEDMLRSPPDPQASDGWAESDCTGVAATPSGTVMMGNNTIQCFTIQATGCTPVK